MKEVKEMENVTLMDIEEHRKSFVEISKSSNPSDKIYIDVDGRASLLELWQTVNKDKFDGNYFSIPSDLFFAGTIPLMDCIINVDESVLKNGTYSCRVIVFDGYDKGLKESNNEEMNWVAMIMTLHTDGAVNFFAPIIAITGEDVIYAPFIGLVDKHIKCHCGCGGEPEPIEQDTLNELHLDMIRTFGTWYGIQLSLLHPLIKEIFQYPKLITDNNKNDNKKIKNKKKRPVKYIRYLRIMSKNIDDIIFGKDSEKRKIERTALIWWVIGHWRFYKNGKKTFIQGYWKGKLRELKIPIPEREREIAQLETAS